MKSFYFFFILAIHLRVSLAQEYAVQPVRGLVTIQNSRTKSGKPIPVINAQVQAGLSTITKTVSDGSFSLSFITKQPGEDVILSIIQPGLEIVNKNQLYVQLKPSSDPVKYLKFYMCKKGEWEKNALLFYKISDSAITKRYRLQIIKLNRSNSTYRADLAKLIKERDQTLAMARELAEKFATENFDEAANLLNTAFMSFKKGNVQNAIAVLDSNKLQLIATQSKQNQMAGKNLIDKGYAGELTAANGFIFRARLLITQLKFKNAENNYKRALEIDSTSSSNVLEAATYMGYRNKFDQALKLFKYLLTLGISDIDSEKVATRIGLIYLIKGDRIKSGQSFKISLKLAEKLNHQNPELFAAVLANSCQNISRSYLLKDSISLSLDYLERAENIYEALVKTDSIYNLSLANIYISRDFIFKHVNNTGLNIKDADLNHTMSDFFSAILGEVPLNKYEQIISYLQKIEKKDTADAVYPKAIALLKSSHYIDESESLLPYKKQIEFLISRVQEYFGAAIIANLRNKEGLSHAFVFEGFDTAFTYHLALKNIQAANVSLEQFARDNPETFNPLLAQNLLLLGQSYFSVGDSTMGYSSFKKSLKYVKDLAASDPQAYLPQEVAEKYSLIDYYALKGIEFALKLNKEAIEKAHQCFQNDSELQDLLLFELSAKMNLLYNNYFKKYPLRLNAERELALSNANLSYNISQNHPNKTTAEERTKAKAYKDYFSHITVDSVRLLGKIDSLYTFSYTNKAKGEEIISTNKLQALIYFQHSANEFNELVKLTSGRAQYRYNLSKVYQDIVAVNDTIPIKELYTKKAIVIVESLLPHNPNLNTDMAALKGNLSYYLILQSKYKEGIEQAKAAIGLDTTQNWIYSNLALGYLYNNNYKKAKEIYLKYKDKIIPETGESYTTAFINDLNAMEKLKLFNKNANKIRKLLSN